MIGRKQIIYTRMFSFKQYVLFTRSCILVHYYIQKQKFETPGENFYGPKLIEIIYLSFYIKYFKLGIQT